MMWDEIKLLEECEPSAAEGILAKVAQRGRITEINRPPQYLYTIEYMQHKSVKKFQCVAEFWGWKDRHKIFQIRKPGGAILTVAEFYCPKEDFIQQTSRLCNM